MSENDDIDMELLDNTSDKLGEENDEIISEHTSSSNNKLVETLSKETETTESVETDIVSESLSEDIENKSKQNSRLPLARIKQMMKFDTDCSLISREALILVSKATELFIQYLAKESVRYTLNNKKKTVSKRDVEAAIECASNLCFLDGALDWE
ncbi:DNA polymerase epsilon subunit 4 [Coccinella septempunctata]|uniref:DNA polymerase epsilon subunit 4 n=1 Tax=Coccinella septempunctata TaxID=41139 RepID=UPI001D0716A2|nr:DNA polymerase epsilon subunit 4 [Coccinella septempunctata]